MYPSRRSKLMHLSILHPPYSFLISATFSPPVFTKNKQCCVLSLVCYFRLTASWSRSKVTIG
nr:MAG TPA: hypothetical protein [Caudoviricetes sp.]